jgi:20S proteasome alpha/beta subunit
VEYAIEAIKLGSTAVGLQTKEGTVLAVEKRLSSPLLDPGSVEKIAEVDIHIGAAMSGLVADARTLVDHARVEAQNHRFTYDEPIGVEALTQGTTTIDDRSFERQNVPRCSSVCAGFLVIKSLTAVLHLYSSLFFVSGLSCPHLQLFVIWP